MKLFKHQEIAVEFVKSRHRSLLSLEPGCISGDSLLQINSHKRGLKISIKDLFFKNWDYSDGKTTSKVWTGTEYKHHAIKQVLFNGFKKACSITVAKNGHFSKKIVCTPDHEILTQRGWIQAARLKLGDYIATNGVKKCAVCNGEKFRASQYGKYPLGSCVRCNRSKACIASKAWQRKPGLLPGESYDKDGYVFVSSCFTHPFKDRYNQVRKHRLVMEKHLGRYLTPLEVVHHKNRDRADNSIANLELCNNSADHHRMHHGQENKRNLSINKFGAKIYWDVDWFRFDERRVLKHPIAMFDLVMQDPHRNYVANGIVVHNCGKTAIAVTATFEFKNVLVICPAFLKINWEREIEKFGGCVKNYTIRSYQYFLRNPFPLDIDFLIIDEPHLYLRNWKSKTTKNVLLAKYMGPAVFLSGSFVVAGAVDLHPILSYAQPGAWGTFKYFTDAFSHSKISYFGRPKKVYYGIKNEEILKEKLKSCMLSMQQKDCLDLPDKMNSVVRLAAKKLPCFDSLAEHRQALGVNKIADTVAYAEMLGKCIVFCYHREVVEEVARLLKCKFIIGGMSDKERQACVDSFQSDADNYLVCSILAAGVGLTLTATSQIIMSELPWTYAEYDQAVCRCHRIGQTEKVISHVLLAGRLDEIVWQTISNKKVFSEVVYRETL